MSQILYIQPLNNTFAELYQTAANVYNSTSMNERNSGFDLFCDATDVGFAGDFTVLVSQGCRAMAVDAGTGELRAFWLAPRSSISRGPWRLGNSMGLIDATYRGILKAALSNLSLPVRPVFHATYDHARLCQVAAADLRPWSEVRVVAALPVGETARGEGGFGSTGR
jgi:dUTP pyrophosphatase